MRPSAMLATVGAMLLVAAGSEAQPVSKVERLPPPAVVAISPPMPIGIEADVYCSGWVGEANETFPGSIFSAEKVDSQRTYFQGDILYMDIGTDDGVDAGQEYWLVRPVRTVYRWGSGLSVLGELYQTPGRIRVICAQEKAAIAEIVLSCSDAEVGDLVLPFEPVPIPLVRRTRPLTSCDGPTEKPVGHIVDVRDGITPLATDTIVFLDLGEKDGLSPGDFLTIFRLGPSSYASAYIEARRYQDVRTVLGEVAILTTKTNTSVGIVTSMKDTMFVGDYAELK